MTVQEICYAESQNYTVSGVGYNPEGTISLIKQMLLSPVLLGVPQSWTVVQ